MTDYYALVNMMEANGTLPKTIIIGVDAWSFDSADTDTRWINSSPDALTLLTKMFWQGSEDRWYLTGRIFDVGFRYFTAGAARIAHHVSHSDIALAWSFAKRRWCLHPFRSSFRVLTPGVSRDSLKKFPDGSTLDPPSVFKTPEESDLIARDHLPRY